MREQLACKPRFEHRFRPFPEPAKWFVDELFPLRARRIDLEKLRREQRECLLNDGALLTGELRVLRPSSQKVMRPYGRLLGARHLADQSGAFLNGLQA
ncbi:MAG TPA: hypothetical protein VE974_17370 [Thermoanaerobaculia bacterium]|nr:hypothetical protein [Thermoanaerobaculia bacterium]